MPCSYWRVRFATLLIWACLLGALGERTKAEDKGAPKDSGASQLREVMGQYVTETIKLSPKDRPRFFTFWEGQFQETLSAVATPSLDRLRMLDELGAIQKTLGKPENAAATYATMIEEARQLEDYRSVVLGLDNAFEIASARLEGSAEEIGEEYVAAAAYGAGKANTEAATAAYANALVSVSLYLNKRVSHPDFAGDKERSLGRAVEFLKAAVTLEYPGATPTATKLYWLAKVHSAAGDKEAAAETFGRIAAMDQDELSPLWMKQLQIEELYHPGTREYCDAIEKVLEEFAASGKVDEHELTLRHLLGKSYYECGEFEKSSAVLSALVGKSNDENMNAYNLLLTADDQAELGQFDAAEDLYRQTMEMYPNSGSAPLAQAGLVRTQNMRAAKSASLASEVQPMEGKATSTKLTILAVNILLVCGVVMLLVVRRLHRGGES